MGHTVPGGYYLGDDGQPHDANGKAVGKMSDRALTSAQGKTHELTPAQREAAAQQRVAEQAALEAEEAAAKADAAVDSAEAGVKAADKQAKQAAKR